MNIQSISDEVSYRLLSKRQPGLVTQIERLLARGVRASQLERYALRRLGETSMTAAVIGGAAHHLERMKAKRDNRTRPNAAGFLFLLGL